MKILFITDLYPISEGEKSTTRALHNFVSEWIKQGHFVDVVRPNFILNSFIRGKKYYPIAFYQYDGVKVFNVNYHTPFLFNIEGKCIVSLRASKASVAIQKSKSGGDYIDERLMPNLQPKSHHDECVNTDLDFGLYDLIIGHMPSGVIFANKIAKKYDIPLVCAVHCSDLAIFKNPFYKFYFRKQLLDAYQNAKKIACRSFVIQRKFVEKFPQFKDKTFVAASGTGVNMVKNDRPVELSAELPIKILTCANLIRRKNIDKLITAVDESEGFELAVIGEGREYKRLKMLANEKIKFLGRLPHEKTLEEMTKYSIFVLPSVSETFGLVYLEAMASGCIVVCTKNDGVDGIILDGENGFLTEPTIEGIKETLLRIKSCENLDKIREKSLRTVKKYTMESCAQNYLSNVI